MMSAGSAYLGGIKHRHFVSSKKNDSLHDMETKLYTYINKTQVMRLIKTRFTPTGLISWRHKKQLLLKNLRIF